MAQLGSLFDADGDGPRGPDLRVTVEVPLEALGASFRAPVPRSLAADGDLVERAIAPDADPDTVELHLPDAVEPRSVLVLRGQGGVSHEAEGRPGNLLILLELVDRPPRANEQITRAPAVVAAQRETEPGIDMTWRLLLVLALLGGGIVVAYYALL